ncbi:MAG: MarR family winged helix-turn-helix transcriptional regulator [Myxococcales bacterium]
MKVLGPGVQARGKEAKDLGPVLDFMRTLWALNHAIEKTSKRMNNEYGVTAQQCTLLRIVGRFPGISAGQLAELLRVHPGTLSAAVNRLERRGLLERRRDPRDQRRVLLGLTARGRALDMPAHDAVGDAVGSVLKGVSAAQMDSVRAVLLELTSQLEPQRPTRGAATAR